MKLNFPATCLQPTQKNCTDYLHYTYAQPLNILEILLKSAINILQLYYAKTSAVLTERGKSLLAQMQRGFHGNKLLPV